MQTFFLTHSQPATQLLTKKRPGRTNLVSIRLDPPGKKYFEYESEP